MNQLGFQDTDDDLPYDFSSRQHKYLHSSPFQDQPKAPRAFEYPSM